MHLLHLRLHAWTSGAVLPLRDLAVPEQSCLSTKGRREPRHPSLLFRAPHPGMAACMHHRSLSCCVIMYRRTWHPSEWMLLKKRASVYAVLGVPCLCCYCLSFFPNRLLFPLLGKFNSSLAASCTPPCPSSGRSPGCDRRKDCLAALGPFSASPPLERGDVLLSSAWSPTSSKESSC